MCGPAGFWQPRPTNALHGVTSSWGGTLRLPGTDFTHQEPSTLGLQGRGRRAGAVPRLPHLTMHALQAPVSSLLDHSQPGSSGWQSSRSKTLFSPFSPPALWGSTRSSCSYTTRVQLMVTHCDIIGHYWRQRCQENPNTNLSAENEHLSGSTGGGMMVCADGQA